MYIQIYLPEGGEQGVIIATRSDGYQVEFRGPPYSQWTADESGPMYQVHSSIIRANISDLHADKVETITPWHAEWERILGLFNEALIPPEI